MSDSTNKTATPAQLKKIASKVIELEHAVQLAQTDFKNSESLINRLTVVENKLQSQLDALNSSTLFIPKNEKRFAAYFRTLKRLERATNQLEESEQGFKTSQSAYDKEKSEKTLKDLQQARVDHDKFLSKLEKETPAAIEQIEKTLKLLKGKSPTKRLPELKEKLIKTSQERTNALAANQEARSKLEKAWKAYEKYVANLKNKSLSR
jgi:hypothetical protein